MPKGKQTVRLTLVVECEVDALTLQWIDELKDTARGYSTIVSCVASGVPSEIDFGN